MNQSIWAQVRTRIMDAKTGLPVRDWSDWQKNLVFDSTLNALATGSIAFSSPIVAVKLGSSSTPNEFVGGTITFTQSGTVITASQSFFTASMIGGIFKYGEVGDGSGAEQYITGQAGTTANVSGAGMSVPSATHGSVWMVQSTTLVSYMSGFATSSLVTSPGNCGTFYNNNTITLLRTFQFGVNGSPYTVNEIGYNIDVTNNSVCAGRVVLVTPDTITTSQFYVVQIALSYTLSPGSPTHIPTNVGTGIDTRGTVMWQCWTCSTINTNGTSNNGGTMDNSGVQLGLLIVAAPTLNSTISQAAAANPSNAYALEATLASYSTTAVGVATASGTFSGTTTGQTVNSLVLGRDTAQGVIQDFVINLDNPFTLPNGAFQATFTYQRVVTRTLIN